MVLWEEMGINRQLQYNLFILIKQKTNRLFLSLPPSLPDLPGSRVREGYHGLIGILHPPQAGLQVVRRTAQAKGT